MQAAFIAIRNALQAAQARLRKAEAEGDKSAYKLPSIRADIRELEQGERALTYTHGEWLKLVRLWAAVEEGNRASVQVSNSAPDKRRGRQHGSNRRRR